MSDFEKHIKEKFTDFEPDISDSAIDINWNKIKCFLPEEKKKKGVLFFITLCALSLLLIVIYSLLGYLCWNETRMQVLSNKDTLKKKGTLNSSIKNNVNNTNSSILIKESLQNNNTSDSINLFSNTKRGSLVIKNANNGKQKKSNYYNQNKAASNTTQLLTTKAKTIPFITNTKLNINIYKKKYFDSIQTINHFEKLEAVIGMLDKNKISVDAIIGNTIVKDSNYIKPKTHKSNLELFGGLSYSFTDFSNSHSKIHTKGYAFGVTENYRLKNKIYVVCQFLYSKTNSTYFDSTNTLEYNKSYTRTGFMNNLLDTIFRQKITKKISPTYFYMISIGLGKTIFNHKKITLNTSFLFDVKFLKIKYSIVNSEEYLQNNQVIPVNNLISTITEHTTTKKTVYTFGLSPFATFSYQVSKRFSPIIKLGYYYPFYSNSIKLNDELFKIKESNFFANLGIQYAF